MDETNNLMDRATRLLTRWAHAAEEYWYDMPGGCPMGCYGSGYLHWGVQSNLNYAAAMATLSAQTAVENKELWRQRAMSALRFALATHVTGSIRGTDGKSWGNSWISMLGIERGMQGLAHLNDSLSTAERDSLRRLLVSEADWLLQSPKRGQHSSICAGLWAENGCNNPESNIWSGSLLWRVAHQYPDEPHAPAWKEQAHRFLMNGVSTESDAHDSTIVGGRPVSEWHVGANFFPNYALDHHGYLNVGYMAICVSNAAILHFDLKQAGVKPPESLYHHEADLWQVLRKFIFSDGRLARIGGDSRTRYSYCQEYLLPSLLFAADHFRDPHALDLAERQIGLMEQDAENGNGLFYAQRLDSLRRNNPHYYTRLESDRACVLSMLLNYLPLVNQTPHATASFDESVSGMWTEKSHGAVMHRSPTRIASFAWRAYGLSQATCMPPDESSMAEWSMNLCPVIRCLGDDGFRTGNRRLLAHNIQSFDGGFVTCGSVMEGVNIPVDEGATCTDQAVTHIAFAALPDNRTCLCLQYVVTANDRAVYLSELKGIHLVIPNDLFNGYRRTLHTSKGKTILLSPPDSDTPMVFESRWANIDDRLGIVVLHGANRMHLDRSIRRRAGRYQSLYTEELCLELRKEITRCRSGEILVDNGFAILAGANSEQTHSIRGGQIKFPCDAVKGIWAEVADGKSYSLLANFSSETCAVTVFGEKIELKNGTAALREVKVNSK